MSDQNDIGFDDIFQTAVTVIQSATIINDLLYLGPRLNRGHSYFLESFIFTYLSQIWKLDFYAL